MEDCGQTPACLMPSLAARPQIELWFPLWFLPWRPDPRARISCSVGWPAAGLWARAVLQILMGGRCTVWKQDPVLAHVFLISCMLNRLYLFLAQERRLLWRSKNTGCFVVPWWRRQRQQKSRQKARASRQKQEPTVQKNKPDGQPDHSLVRKGVPNKKDREATTFLKMDWSKLNWHNGFFEDHEGGSGCTAEYFIAHQLVGAAGHNWALCTMDPKKVISNFTRLETLASGTKVEYWRVSDLPKRLQSKCCWWGGED